jgi:EF-P beta-lysylation protein EpmB
VHCRYCFRRHLRHATDRPWSEGWRAAFAYISARASIREVILSGGDPLSVDDQKLARLASDLSAIGHLERLRVHTRMPVVVPERVDDDLLRWLTGGRLQPIVVLQVNHRREIDRRARASLARLKRGGVTLLNQAVLLRGVNDDVETLRRLSEALSAAGVLPYYLHLLDRVRGASHFEVGEGEARELVRGLRRDLPGYLVPRLVREVAGESAKVPIGD